MNEELLAAVRQAINDTGDHILMIQAQAAVDAVEAFGYILPAGVEFAVKRGDVTEEVGFNTEEQALRWARDHIKDSFTIHRRPVGTWDQVDGALGLPSENPEDMTKGEGNV
jgi:hypothetical protein